MLRELKLEQQPILDEKLLDKFQLVGQLIGKNCDNDL
jgi:hypothetical protein